MATDCGMKRPNETVEKVPFWHFHEKAILENKGVMNIDLLSLRVFLQPQRRASGVAESGSAADAGSRRLHALVRHRRAPTPRLGRTSSATARHAIPAGPLALRSVPGPP